VSEASNVWADNHALGDILFWTVGTGSYVLVQHGKNLVRLLARFSRQLSVVFHRISHFFEDIILSWDKLFPSIEMDTRRITNQERVRPIKETAYTSTRPTFPWSVGVTLTVAIALAIAAFSIGPFGTRSSQTTIVKQIADTKSKSDRQKIPATFADRFTLPQDCMGCGGPEVDLVPMPKPNPILSNVPFPRPRP
jgi:hypothetical protein